ncbi:MAG: hypothetical protein DIU68_019795 [Chloroflexota bacterium]|nr:MAG: hypothetical protein DIU68_15755 [Chloroflexota bacterium]
MGSLRRFYFLFLALLVTSCSSLPGLRVLTGEDTGEAAANRVVQTLDLVMADKSGATDPSLIAAADRIEAASGNVDIIEIRKDLENDEFVIHMLYRPPQTPQTLEGQVMELDARRRAFELAWQAVLPETLGSEKIRIRLLFPIPVSTLDRGASFIGQIAVDAEIAREDAAAYLSGERNLDAFYSLILNGVMAYRLPETFEVYDGRPNHPMFMLSPAE